MAYRISDLIPSGPVVSSTMFSIHFSAVELHEPCLGHIVENRVTLAALYQVMAGHGNIIFEPGIHIETLSAADSVGRRTLKLSDGRELTTALLVGADGAHPTGRRRDAGG